MIQVKISDIEDVRKNDTEIPSEPPKQEMLAAFDTVRTGLQFAKDAHEYAFHGHKCKYFLNELKYHRKLIG